MRPRRTTGPRLIGEIMQDMPIFRLVMSRRFDDPNWPTAQDIADAHWGLSKPRTSPQQPLPFEDEI